ncbi:large ribosomal subunit protein bL17m-like [Artemia franciscana]|uniref:large ribosomal subunit protein bL17m-like n=1 Tax=Artemia franciscana TaxID=6661 RepID=UPI0032DB2503
MSQMPELTKLVSSLKIRVNPKPLKMSNARGPEGRLIRLRKTVTALVKYERVEINWHKGQEARGYAERLISDAIRHGDTHKDTMEMASYWLEEKQLVHKLFKVLAPRFSDINGPFTRVLRLPRPLHSVQDRVILELRGNLFPAIVPEPHNKNLLTNILVDEARREYKTKKYSEFEEDLSKSEPEPSRL